MKKPYCESYLKMSRMRSYTVGVGEIYPLVISAITVAFLTVGCSSVSMQVGSDDVSQPTLLTGSITSDSDVAFADIGSDDRQVIARNLDSLTDDLAVASDLSTLSLPWQNTSSGNSGTISSINHEIFLETGCLTFKTTANTIVGIKLYAGTACRDVSQKFAVTALTVETT